MSNERRRYFRIDETVGISYEVIDPKKLPGKSKPHEVDVLDLVAKQDQQIEKLLLEVAEDNPKVAQLVTIFNQKLERIVNQLVLDSHLVGKIAHRVQEANISACGIAFATTEEVPLDTHIKLELTLFPSKKTLSTNGIIISCDKAQEGWYWRIDFYGMPNQVQEELIQHIVQSQSTQLKAKRP
ncbi:hypothetical protein TDB9533_01927 [Thalassocella blandensis]|nr:hypothetical protein TDB9533_01927 [Thalassocella blandensis]